MYKIALCDDKEDELLKTRSLINSYKRSHPHFDCSLHCFTSMQTLLTTIEAYPDFDLLVLDIYLPKKTGIEAAKELRGGGFSYPIIFLTTSKEFALEAFSVNAIQYLVKPVSEKDFFAALDLVFEYTREKKRRYVTIKTDGQTRRVAFSDIIFVEAGGNYQCIHLPDKNILNVRMTSAEMFDILSVASNFVRCGASFIVNLAHVSCVAARDIQLDSGEKIPVPRGAYAVLREQYFNYYCER